MTNHSRLYQLKTRKSGRKHDDTANASVIDTKPLKYAIVRVAESEKPSKKRMKFLKRRTEYVSSEDSNKKYTKV